MDVPGYMQNWWVGATDFFRVFSVDFPAELSLHRHRAQHRPPATPATTVSKVTH